MHTHKLKRQTAHTFQYLVLFLLMATAFFAFINTTGRPQDQRMIGIIVAITYFIWGIYHHIYNNDLNYKIVLEYLALAVLGLGLFWAIIY